MNSQPSSLLRKSTGKSLSMGSATRTSLLGSRNGFEALGYGVPTSAKRRSLLSTPASTNKRRQSLNQLSSQLSSQISSQINQIPNQINQTPIQNQITHHQNVISSSQSSQQTPQKFTQQTPQIIDQRPLKDKNYQQLIQQEIYEFLVSNKFEIEMNHTINSKTLKQPTQKDFILIFKFLYNKIDPYYEFSKSIEVEIFSLLKILNYPYLDSINRSQISAVGGQNWPSFLGILYWLIKLNISIISLDINDSFISTDDEFDRIFIKYIRDSYNSFINENDDYNEFYQEMKVGFEKVHINLLNEIETLQTENQQLTNQFNQLNHQLIELQQAEKKSLALEDDLIKFKEYIKLMESRKLNWIEILDKINLEITHCKEELSQINANKDQYEATILDQGLTINDINILNSKRDQVSKSIDSFNQKLNDLNTKLYDKDIDLVKNYQSLNNFINQYNKLILKMKTPSYNFEIKLNEDIIRARNKRSEREGEDEVETRRDLRGIINDLNDKYSFDPFKSNEIIDKVLKDEKIELLKYRNEIGLKIHKYQDEQIKLQEQCDLINEKIVEQTDLFDNIGNKLTTNKLNYDDIYETMINDSTTYTTQIEKLDRELRSIKINSNQGFIELENKYQNTLIEFDELNHSLLKSKKALYDKCLKIAEFIMNFKLNIQSNLLDLDDLATIELEIEQKSNEVDE